MRSLSNASRAANARERAFSSAPITTLSASTRLALTNAKFAVITAHSSKSALHRGPNISGAALPTYPMMSIVTVLSTADAIPQRRLSSRVVSRENPKR